MESINLNKMIKLRKEKRNESLINIILLDNENEELIKETTELGYKLFSYGELICKSISFSINLLNPCTLKTIATLCYTSGVTGIPKGAMLSHKALCSNVCAVLHHNQDKLALLDHNDVHISYLQIAHVMERVMITAMMMKGGSIGFASFDKINLFEDTQILKPTIFLGVPKVYIILFDVLREKFYNLNYMQKNMVDRALSTKLNNYSNSGQLCSMIWDKLIFGNMKDILGGKVRIMLTGSAPIDSSILDFLRICFSCPIIEGYGQTESCGGFTFTKLEDYSGGNVGGPLYGCEIKLVDVPELNYFSAYKDENGTVTPCGEICVRGNLLFSGYFNDKENTNIALDKEGWLHTGDIGKILPNKGLRIIDRIKNIFKLNNGEYIAPVKIESILIKSKYINQIFIYGDSHESYIVGIAVPNINKVIEYFKEVLNLEISEKELNKLINDKRLICEILEDLSNIAKKEGLKSYEQIKKIYLVLDQFTNENNLLTPTLKTVRKLVYEKFSKEIDRLYEEDLR